MPLTKQDINELANFARLDLKPDEIEKFVGEVANMFRLISTLRSVNTDDIPVFEHPLGQTQRLRADQIIESDQHKKFQTLAPLIAADLYLVPQVIE